MEMTYRQNGDYLIPDIRLSEQEAVSYTHLDVYKRQGIHRKG